MNTFIIIFNFNDYDGHWSMSTALEDHPQIVEIMREMHSVQILPNIFLVQTEEMPDALLSEFTPYLDRGEDVFVLTASAPWTAVASKDKLDWLSIALG